MTNSENISAVFPEKPNTLIEIFGGQTPKPLIGVLHLKPLPGAPRYAGEPIASVIDHALRDAERYLEGGLHGLIVENGWDIPFAKPGDIGPETIAAMTAVAQRVKQTFDVPMGVNCLANAAIASLAVAKAADAQFVRVNQWVNAYIANEGFIEGAAAKALRYRANIRADNIKIFADVHVKHGAHAIVADRSLAEQTRDAVWFDADVLIATGKRTGHATPVDEILGIQAQSPLPVIIGSGLSADNARESLAVAQGAIIGTALKVDGFWWNPVDKDRVAAIIDAVG